jgi:hypothetical protein
MIRRITSASSCRFVWWTERIALVIRSAVAGVAAEAEGFSSDRAPAIGWLGSAARGEP